MTTISSVAATTTTTANQSSTSSRSEISADFQTFLTMLTAQLQNQDPLNPVDSTDYATQLATFSGVEQQVKTNDLLESLAAQLGASGMSELAGWVGMEARTEAPAWFDGSSPVTLAPNPVRGADQTVLVVTDANGNAISREAISTTNEQLSWAGQDGSGGTLPEGLYSFSLESYNSGTLIDTSTVETYGRITEAQGSADGTQLILRGGTVIATSAVNALREG
ncbi:flagellar hook capping FlgD N-terminal domain-containing protein [Thioclava sp.]|uniref:flagellar hook capping FlgD N-terminal domain-containing protein n=1 Tax=Thioclava sp. TaxID=1933450 RepID=UPI003AA7BE82